MDLEGIQRSFESEAPTRVDLEPRTGRSRLAVWISAAILAAGTGVALDWIATSYRADPDAPPAASENAPAEMLDSVRSGADTGTPLEEAVTKPEAGAEPSRAPRKAPGPPGWEIVR
jgi:hypothetical protein